MFHLLSSSFYLSLFRKMPYLIYYFHLLKLSFPFFNYHSFLVHRLPSKLFSCIITSIPDSINILTEYVVPSIYGSPPTIKYPMDGISATIVKYIINFLMFFLYFCIYTSPNVQFLLILLHLQKFIIGQCHDHSNYHQAAPYQNQIFPPDFRNCVGK